ncbi:MAG: SDR family NAD(P)-dependent oxidoreductase, partial [Planctomycetales bacterium]|nr:SDR family NAD(P)-dependent oxidoreductase [Planctomycetales bacterium]
MSLGCLLGWFQGGDALKKSPFDLTGRVAVVTGASRGLGQQFGSALAAAGADLIVTSRNASDLEE